ncbi:DEAD/DEAH box helicase [Muricoccus radiodurans]|uniref:DEAD/DEAH box helicase n=1 Tax=Muricoccus radiodurans TaxID=2231721 RepID=UPI003CF74C30
METEPEALLAARLIECAAESAGGVIHVARSPARAARLAAAAQALGEGVAVIHLPAWDCLPYDRVSPGAAVMGARMEALHRLATESGPRLLIASVEAAGQRLPDPAEAVPLVWRCGDALDAEAAGRELLRLGYADADGVADEPGEFALRGEVLDIFPALESAAPHRLEWQDGRIVAIRRYDPLTQRSEAEVEFVTLPPASEYVPGEEATVPRAAGIEHALPAVIPRLVSVFELLPEAALVLEPEVTEARQRRATEIADAFRLRIALGTADEDAPPLVEPTGLYLDAAAWKAALRGRQVIEATAPEEAETPRPVEEDDPEEAFLELVDARCAAGQRVALAGAGGRAAALIRLLRRHRGAAPQEVPGWLAFRDLPPGTVAWIRAPLLTGFATPDATVIAAAEVLPPRPAGRDRLRGVAFGEAVMRPGDAVIHLDHGLAALRGIERVEAPAAPGAPAAPAQDCLRLEFAAGAMRLVPAEEMDRVWRYGAEAEEVTLDRAGGESWAKRRAGVETALEETARAMLGLAAERDQRRAPVLRPPGRAMARFVAGFPFTATPDQQAAADDALADLASGRPMDRLVCGDVGYGKTEVALRAAAAAALAGAQVAVLAPTTVLARQHLDTFRRRFAGFDVVVEGLSRLTSAAEARRVRAGLADGSVRVVVGTHALLSKTVRFQKLGLVVVDEEQRFGARQKTALRNLAEGVHLLTLTATPIPRTLQAALVGMQDLSVIATPPARRQPIRTGIAPLDDALLGTALLRERRRGGQSFVVVPRIEDMAPMRERLRRAGPRLRVIEVHGEMPAQEADDAMIAFAEGGADVLLSTSIIESGLDVPRANTMLVWHPDRFGLSQLHQLRGRVGRGGVRGAIWLLTDPDDPPAEGAMKRLRTLEAMDRVGAGFAIAARDLDLRGAGDLLGEEQAGHVRLIGLDLYQHLLEEALRAARGESRREERLPAITLPVPASIPAEYVPDEALRVELHARAISLLRRGEAAALEDLSAEVADRFGPPPPEVLAWLDVARLRARAARLGILRLEVGPKASAADFAGNPPEVEPPLEARNGRVILPRPSADPEAAIHAGWELLARLNRLRRRGRTRQAA